ncbi:MAG: glycosyltransferase [Candidatus ainarchaeum sp.]|nr:glycosyltransferase [Candidatus ainarchaeum sp.]
MKNNQKSILHYFWKYSPSDMGGVEMYISSLASSLNKDFDFSIIADKVTNQKSLELLNKLNVYRFGPKKEENSSQILRFFDILKNENEREKNKTNFLSNFDYNLIHVHGPLNYSNSVLGGALFFNQYHKQSWLKSTKPKIMTFHGLPSVVLDNKYSFPFSKNYFSLWKKIEEKNVFDSNKVICVDKYVIDELKSRGIKQDLEFIPNGIDLGKFSPLSKEKARKKVIDKFGNIFDENLCFLYLNRLSTEKGIEEIFNLSKSNLKFRIIISGTGVFEEKIKQLCINDSRFVYVGSIENSFAPILMNACDYVLTPLKHPGATRTNIEAIATNTPVITTNIHNRYPVIDEKNGFIYDNSKPNELINVLKKIIRTEPKFKQSVFNTKKDFDLSIVSKKIKKIYNEYI